jgi:hypothetical protein
MKALDAFGKQRVHSAGERRKIKLINNNLINLNPQKQQL